MPFEYRIDVLAALKGAGYSSCKIRQKGLSSQSALQKLREGTGVSWENIQTICRLLNCQPVGIMEYTE